MDNIAKKHPEYSVGLCLLQFEALCHFELIKYLVDISTMDKIIPKYGCENGLKAFIMMGYRLDASVFLYESIKHLLLLSPNKSIEITNMSLYSDLEVIRNNIHTYFKKGGFAKKSNAIVDEKIREYKLDKLDFTTILRNDLSLVFQIIDRSRHIVGCDYFIKHCIFESNKKKWSGEDYRDYAAFVTGGVKGIAATVDEVPYQLPYLKFMESMPTIELFDFKSADLEACSALSYTITFRLMLMLYEISYILILLEEIFNFDVIINDDLWSCFFGKLLAIKYDESFDNLESLMNFSEENNKKQLDEYLKCENLILDNLAARSFAQKLRNTIHYQDLKFDVNILGNCSTREIVKAIFLENANVQDMNGFKSKIMDMMNEMKKLQKAIRKIISVDKEYSI